MAATGSSELLREATRGFLAREAPLSAVRAGLERPRELDRAAWAWPEIAGLADGDGRL